MIRIEIIANQSVQDELISNIESLLPELLYTIIPLANGKGKNSYKKGDTTWPETNFVFIAYAEENIEKKISQIVRFIKLKFSTEGIKLFILHDNKV